MITAIDPAQRTAANATGVSYLSAMATSMFAELVLRAPLIVRGNAAQTALNIAASETVFRLSSIIHLLTFASDAAIAVALYVVLKPVHRHLALLAASWRLADCAVLSLNIVNDFAVLRFLADPPMAQTFLRIGAAGFQVGFVLLGLGSTLFSWLWLKSRYVPRVIAAWGIFASLVLTFVTLAVMVFPKLGATLGLMYMAPMFFYEVGLGLWLLIKGLR